MPVIETGVGNVHIYVDADADLELAERIVINSKVSRPSVCNAAETLLVHKEVAAIFIPQITSAFHAPPVNEAGSQTSFDTSSSFLLLGKTQH